MYFENLLKIFKVEPQKAPILNKLFITLVLIGFLPVKLRCEQCSAQASYPFVSLSVPKSGTHMLTKCLRKLTGKIPMTAEDSKNKNFELWFDKVSKAWENNKFYSQHHYPVPGLPELLVKNQFKVIFLIRDPRDQTLSCVKWLLEGKWPGEMDPRFLSEPASFDEKLLEAITGQKYGISTVEKFICRNIGWLEKTPDLVYVVKYEDLVGPEGGGDRDKQINAIIGIAKHIGIQLDKKQANEIALSLYGGTDTFREGQLNKWKKTFKPVHKKAFKELYGNLLIYMGYEKSLDW